jgi:hypothetical protein
MRDWNTIKRKRFSKRLMGRPGKDTKVVLSKPKIKATPSINNVKGTQTSSPLSFETYLC